MPDRKPLTPEEISAIVNGLNPIDWAQMKLLANLPPGKRIIPMLQATEMVRAGLRTAFHLPSIAAYAKHLLIQADSRLKLGSLNQRILLSENFTLGKKADPTSTQMIFFPFSSSACADTAATMSIWMK